MNERTVGSTLWVAIGGIALAFGYGIAGLLVMVTIVGIPVGLQVFRLANFAVWPFDRAIVERPERSLALTIVGNVVWIIVGGWWLALLHLVVGGIFTLTIVGRPFAVLNVRMARLILTPVGKQVVTIPEIEAGDEFAVGPVRNLGESDTPRVPQPPMLDLESEEEEDEIWPLETDDRERPDVPAGRREPDVVEDEWDEAYVPYTPVEEAEIAHVYSGRGQRVLPLRYWHAAVAAIALFLVGLAVGSAVSGGDPQTAALPTSPVTVPTPGVVPSASVPTLSPSPAGSVTEPPPASAVPSAARVVNQVAVFSGTGTQTTKPFNVSSPWEIRWEAGGDSFQIILFDSNDLQSQAANQMAPGSGSSYQQGAGAFHLRIDGAAKWTVYVYQLAA